MRIDRRSLMKKTLAGVVTSAWSLAGQPAQAATDREPVIKIAGYDYDRVRAITDGKVGLTGSRFAFDFQDIYALNQLAFGPKRKYEVTELGLILYVTKFINENFRAYTLVPVLISRIFRHRNVYVHVDAGIEKPEDLRGKRVGVPGYGSSSNTWVRGFLQDEYGVQPDEIQWIETTKSSDQALLVEADSVPSTATVLRIFSRPTFP